MIDNSNKQNYSANVTIKVKTNKKGRNAEVLVITAFLMVATGLIGVDNKCSSNPV